MDEKRTPKRLLVWKPIGRRIRGRPRKRWIDDVEEDIQGVTGGTDQTSGGCSLY